MKRLMILVSILLFAFVACKAVFSLSHPANAYFNNLEYPRLGFNQISTRTLQNNPGLINQLAKFDFVIINKSDDLFVDGDANYAIANKIKAINPKVKVLQYLNITDVWGGQKTFKTWASAHPGAILTDGSGNPIHPYAKQYGNKRYMMDSTNLDWQNYFAQRVEKITDQGMDGVFIDNIWRSNYQNLNISKAKFSQLRQGWELMIQKSRALIGSQKIIIGNGPADPLYQTRDITMIEGRLAPNKRSLDEYFRLSSQSKNYGQLNFDTVKYKAYTGQNFITVQNFLLPAVLMTDNLWGISYDTDQWFPFLDNLGKIGHPQGEASRGSNGILIRNFSKGRVYLNDTSSPVTINLPTNSYANVENTVINLVRLSPMTGIVLKKV